MVLVHSSSLVESDCFIVVIVSRADSVNVGLTIIIIDYFVVVVVVVVIMSSRAPASQTVLQSIFLWALEDTTELTRILS